ncbi:hypothetical protein [Natrinema versiforme]
MSPQKRRSRSRKSTTTATITGSGEKETRSSPNTKRQLAPTSRNDCRAAFETYR